MVKTFKAIALIQIGRDLCVCDFSIPAEPGDMEEDFLGTAHFYFEEKHGPESVNIDSRFVDYFEASEEYEVLSITLCQYDYIKKENAHKVCPDCLGSGDRSPGKECMTCQGFGRVKK
jgi:hypothetical protein